MDRVPYRRVTPARGDTFEAEPPKATTISAGETLLLQLLISAGLVVLALFIRFVNVPPMATLQNGLQQALSGPATVEALTTDMRRFAYQWLNIGGEPTQTLDLPMFDIPLADMPVTDTLLDTHDTLDTTPPPEAPQPPEQPKITPPTVYDAYPNPQIPGPSVSPGLRD
ncbi:MAG: hypothetical protein FWG38_04145 [Defluviitaleaceae bacterium]|nr:hypothetical protein [Defluviitaleaceae bacterium]